MTALQLLKKLELRGIMSSKSRKNDTDNADALLSSGPSDDSSTSSRGVALKKKQKQPAVTEIPVLPPIETKKGGPRTALYALCKQMQWPLPTFETTENKSKTLMQLGDATGLITFESQICLSIPDSGKIEVTGEARADKKSSFDSAALLMLYEVERRGEIVIGSPS